MPSMISSAPSGTEPHDRLRELAASLPLHSAIRHALDPHDAAFASLAPVRSPQDPDRVLSAGEVWTRRATDRDGRGLYAPEAVEECPRWVLSSLEGLAVHGVRAVDVSVAAPVERLRGLLAPSQDGGAS